MRLKKLSDKAKKELWARYLNAPKKVKDEIALFRINAYPDTNEGRFGPRPQGYVLVRGEKKFQNLLLQNFLYEIYGPPLTFGMGDYLVENWLFFRERISIEGFPFLILPELLAVIESPDSQQRADFIWLEWNHLTKQFFPLQEQLKQKNKH